MIVRSRIGLLLLAALWACGVDNVTDPEGTGDGSESTDVSASRGGPDENGGEA